MGDVRDVNPDLDKMDSQLDKVEDALQPLLGNLAEVSSQLPLLDRAKLFALTAYSIESLLFCALKFSDADAQQSQEVMDELKRVQQYFLKIKNAEAPSGAAAAPEAAAAAAQRSTTVNQEAAARLLKADLADNKDIRNKLAEKIAEERAKALLKSMEKGGGRKRPAEDSPQPSSVGSGSEMQGDGAPAKKTKKKHGGKEKKRGKKQQ
ncbi:hypothetical protein N3K66_000821 [Trichothecium roseum]|uniref:Uncharacterized protein n=1 Tax=Trichothecium roseum TaxID=47278 RepID=A0ACC0VD28_9HYPO|nr:hypothetical protein N3K66_000821 [Trichothecium roseum]